MTIETPIATAPSRRVTANSPSAPQHEPHSIDELLRLVVGYADGTRITVDAAQGLRLVELIRAHGLPIKAECGGAGVCATCHVRISAPWSKQLPPASEDELAKLDEIPGAGEHSRLACQIEMTSALDGLEFTIETDSLLPHAILAAR